MIDSLDQLKNAIFISPDNIFLRLQFAELLLRKGFYDESVKQFQEVLHRNYGNEKARKGLANVYLKQKKYSAAILVFESLSKDNLLSGEEYAPYIKCLIKERSLIEAVEVYKILLQENPNFRDEEIDEYIKRPVSSRKKNNELKEFFDSDEEEGDDDFDEDGFESDFKIEKPALKYSDVFGLDEIKKVISLKIILPKTYPKIASLYGKKSGGGILLYGPPGCGKTFIAKATAGEVDMKFLYVGINDIMDLWVGNAERNLHDVFEQARQSAPCVLFFDEVDAVTMKRKEVLANNRQVVSQFLEELDGIKDNNEGVLVMAATSLPWTIDNAFKRHGRFDKLMFVPPPDLETRKEYFKFLLRDKPKSVALDYDDLALQSEKFSISDLQSVIDNVIDIKMYKSIEEGGVQDVFQEDILKSINNHQNSVDDWIINAKESLSSYHESNLYKDLWEYIKQFYP